MQCFLVDGKQDIEGKEKDEDCRSEATDGREQVAVWQLDGGAGAEVRQVVEEQHRQDHCDDCTCEHHA